MDSQLVSEALGRIWFQDLKWQVGWILSANWLFLGSETPLPRSESSSDFLIRFLGPPSPLESWQKGFGVCGIGIPFYWITFNIINLIQESIDPTAFSGTFEVQTWRASSRTESIEWHVRPLRSQTILGSTCTETLEPAVTFILLFVFWKFGNPMKLS